MTVPYTSQTISNYNTSPPADDATAVASNQLFWSKHKDKLADPIKTLAEAVNTETLAAFGQLDLNQKRAITTNDTQLAADERKLISATNSPTYTLLAAVTAGDGFVVTVLNAGTGATTIEGDSSELIDGNLNIVLSRQGDAVKLRCNAVGWDIVADNRRVYSYAIDFAEGADVASATTTDIWGTDGNTRHVTGTTTITSLGTAPQAGADRWVIFDGILTLTHGANLNLPGSVDITTAAGDFARVYADTTTQLDVQYFRADGTSVAGGLKEDTPQATTSGTSFDFTANLTAAKRITIVFNDVSLSGSDNIIVQIGDSGGVETTGYVSTSATQASTSGYLFLLNLAGRNANGIMTLINISGNIWIESHAGVADTGVAAYGGGNKTLSATLDTVRVTRTGTNTFDAGSVNVLVEA